ncbi:hypothetical protein E2C01_069513 [Portunus trituberculatus]|uniref:Uncharacterized protein n=1 Tax=Portunus trituberculatus TaxID=210409 RepID=A0A5B7I2E3_PORTR|nr:hypothetical protein [Portunus trituberculatus]
MVAGSSFHHFESNSVRTLALALALALAPLSALSCFRVFDELMDIPDRYLCLMIMHPLHTAL